MIDRRHRRARNPSSADADHKRERGKYVIVSVTDKARTPDNKKRDGTIQPWRPVMDYSSHIVQGFKLINAFHPHGAARVNSAFGVVGRAGGPLETSTSAAR